jgi:hypothetical protein
MADLTILVDYDNIDLISRRRGLKFIANGIISQLDDVEFTKITEIKLRLYGGWFSKIAKTTFAENLNAEIYRDFPSIVMNTTTKRIYKVEVELAYGLLSFPSIHFFDTYRIRGFQTDIKSKPPSQEGCIDLNCPVRLVYEFITNGSCKNQCCNITPEDILYKGVQKLVDNMICCDIIYLAASNPAPIVLVSSDEDFWPVIFSVIKNSKKIIHIHSKPNRTLQLCYKNISNNFYIEKQSWSII